MYKESEEETGSSYFIIFGCQKGMEYLGAAKYWMS
jgi:hypothetical protein